MRVLSLQRRRRGERGAVAVEAALVLPVIMLLVFGMIDMSLMLRDYVSITAATRAGTRLAAAEADAGPCVNQASDTTTCTAAQGTTIPEVAQDAADTMQRNLTGVDNATVNYLLVYQANKNGYPCTNAGTCNAAIATKNGLTPDSATTMPSTCSGYVRCVKFTWSPTAAAGAGAFRYGDGSWTSSTIAACQGYEDSVGVYVNLSHKWLTGVISTGSFTLTDKSVMQFEPLSTDTCDSSKTSPHR